MNNLGALSDNSQAAIMFGSLALIGIAAVAPPEQFPYYVKYLLAIVGVIGASLKEAFGAK